MDLVFSDLKEVISYADCWSIGREAILHLFFNCLITPEHMLYAVGNQHLRPPPLNSKLLCNSCSYNPCSRSHEKPGFAYCHGKQLSLHQYLLWVMQLQYRHWQNCSDHSYSSALLAILKEALDCYSPINQPEYGLGIVHAGEPILVVLHIDLTLPLSTMPKLATSPNILQSHNTNYFINTRQYQHPSIPIRHKPSSVSKASTK